MRSQLVALVAASSLTTGWILASILSPPVAELQVLPERAPRRVETRDLTVVPYTEQLHLKLQAAPARPRPGRNPFVFATAPPTSARRVTALPGELSAGAVPADAPPAPSGPALRLTGLASSDTASGTVWTAIISDTAGIHLLKVGETIAGLTVVEISPDTVVLADAVGERQTLRRGLP